MFPEIGAMPVFVVVNGAIFPLPRAGRLMAVLLFVHAYVVPVTLKALVKLIASVDVPTHLP
jgi:hypothetical protein